jgi:ASC-1-like (ASCH) protein
MTEFIMKLFSDSFDRIKLGQKKREYRLYDEKRRKIKVGDTIKFLKLPNLDDEIRVRINKIEVFDNWYDCYEKYFDEDFKGRYESIEAVVMDTYDGGYYTREESEKNKCVIFHFDRI